MASKTYTAQEMREMADAIAGDLCDNGHRSVEYTHDDLIPVIESLRQAADAMDCEKKYEYGLRYCVDDGSVIEEERHCDTIDDAKEIADISGFDELKFIRREVGEWEEVRDGK